MDALGEPKSGEPVVNTDCLESLAGSSGFMLLSYRSLLFLADSAKVITTTVITIITTGKITYNLLVNYKHIAKKISLVNKP